MRKCDTCYWDVNGCNGRKCIDCEHKDEEGQCYCTLPYDEEECPYYRYDETLGDI